MLRGSKNMDQLILQRVYLETLAREAPSDHRRLLRSFLANISECFEKQWSFKNDNFLPNYIV